MYNGSEYFTFSRYKGRNIWIWMDWGLFRTRSWRGFLKRISRMVYALIQRSFTVDQSIVQQWIFPAAFKNILARLNRRDNRDVSCFPSCSVRLRKFVHRIRALSTVLGKMTIPIYGDIHVKGHQARCRQMKTSVNVLHNENNYHSLTELKFSWSLLGEDWWTTCFVFLISLTEGNPFTHHFTWKE